MNDPIRVVHLIGGSITGGAARGAYWLHQGLREIGVASSVLTDSTDAVADPDVAYARWAPERLSRRAKATAAQHLERLHLSLHRRRQPTVFTLGLMGMDLARFSVVRAADVLHLHWIGSGFVGPTAIGRLGKPVVWTLRDMWPITGGCHHAMGCDRFSAGCGRCPQLRSRWTHDATWWMARHKRRGYPRQTTFVALSSWLADEARRSYVAAGKEIVTIGNGIDCQEFRPADRGAARRAIGVASSPVKTVLAGAQNAEDCYKGFDLLLEALDRLDRAAYRIVVFGRGGAERLAALGFDVRDLGFLATNTALRDAYSAADVFVAPSRVEAFGKTMTEAMACGCPVVCFDATGPRDIVDHRVNGYRAAPFDPADLAAGIEWVCADSERRKALGAAAREKVITSFEQRVIARRYAALYARVTSPALETPGS